MGVPTWTWHLATPKISSGVGIPKRSFGSFRHKATRTRVGSNLQNHAVKAESSAKATPHPRGNRPSISFSSCRRSWNACCEHAKKKAEVLRANKTPPLQKTAKGQWEPAEALQLCVQNSCFFFLIPPDLQTVPRSHLKAGFCAPRDLDLNQRGGNWK